MFASCSRDSPRPDKPSLGTPRSPCCLHPRPSPHSRRMPPWCVQLSHNLPIPPRPDPHSRCTPPRTGPCFRFCLPIEGRTEHPSFESLLKEGPALPLFASSVRSALPSFASHLGTARSPLVRHIGHCHGDCRRTDRGPVIRLPPARGPVVYRAVVCVPLEERPDGSSPASLWRDSLRARH